MRESLHQALLDCATQLPNSQPVATFEAFGPEAERFARLLPQGIQGIICDGTQAAEALARAVALRRSGIPFFVSVLLEDFTGVIARSLAPTIFENYQHIDDRRQGFESILKGTLILDQVSISRLSAYPSQLLATLRELCRMGDALIVRSQTERLFLETCWNLRRSYYALSPIVDPSVPLSNPDPMARRIVIWAPETPARQLTILAYALWELKEPAIFICRDALTGTPHEYVSPADAQRILPMAAVIIDPNLADPGAALAFAGRGYGLVAPKTSGAHEYIQGLMTYAPDNPFDIYGAVARARAHRRNFGQVPRRSGEYFQEILDASRPHLPPHLPLVSIAVPTFNRRADLQRSLEGFARQKYSNLEVLVVNDCGEDVSDIVAQFPFARYLVTPKNGGSVKAVNYALSQAQGDFWGLVADDDIDYPDHISSVMSAILSSGLKVGYGNIVLRLDTFNDANEVKTYGHHLIHDADLEPLGVLWCGCYTHMQGYLAHRSVFEAMGFLNENQSCASDIDGIMAMASNYDIAHADHVIGEMAYRDDRSNQSAKAGIRLVDEFREVMARHCPPDRPLISYRQSKALEGVLAGQTRGEIFSPHIRLEHLIDLPK